MYAAILQEHANPTLVTRPNADTELLNTANTDTCSELVDSIASSNTVEPRVLHIRS